MTLRTWLSTLDPAALMRGRFKPDAARPAPYESETAKWRRRVKGSGDQ